MFKNKHIIIAMLVAPMLAIMAWFAVDYFVAERPQAAEPGGVYPLVARPNCRRPSEGCELVNADFEITVTVTTYTTASADVEVTSQLPLAQATVSIANDNVDAGAPTVLERADEQGLRWRGTVNGRLEEDSELRVAVGANEATFYGEVPVTFFFTE